MEDPEHRRVRRASTRAGTCAARAAAGTDGDLLHLADAASAILGHLGMSGLVSGMPSGNPPSGLKTNGHGSYVGGTQPQPGRD